MKGDLEPTRGPARRLRAGLRRHGVIPSPAGLRALLRSPQLRTSAGNAFELYVDGPSGLDAMLEAIPSARRRIHFETYIFRSDTTGWAFAHALEERARAGVEVRLLIDAVGARGLDPALPAALRAAGADVVVFNPLTRLWPHWAPRRRDHRKILVVDSEVGFTGGLNVGDEYRLGHPDGAGRRLPWRDAHLQLRGPVVRMLDAVFLESWFRADGPDRPWLDAPEAPAEAGDQVLGVLADGPTYHRRAVRDLLLEALAASTRRALLATPYFVPGRRLRQAIGDAAARGVAVDLLIAGTSDHPSMRWAAHALVPGLLAKGVRVFEFEGAMMHAKLAVFDERLALVGSSNLDRQSLRHSYEVNVVAQGGALPGRVARVLTDALAEARPLGADELGRRSLPVRLRDRLAATIAGARA